MSLRMITAAALSLVLVTAGEARPDFWHDLQEAVGLANQEAEAKKAKQPKAEAEKAKRAAPRTAPATRRTAVPPEPSGNEDFASTGDAFGKKSVSAGKDRDPSAASAGSAPAGRGGGRK